MLSLLLLASAHATLYFGNPNLGFRVDRPAGDYVAGSVTLDKVRVHHCGGGFTDYEVDSVIDPVAGYTLTIAGGDHCALTFAWASALVIEGHGSLGPFTVRYAAGATTVPLSEEIAPVALTPYSVASGSMSGGAPWLLAFVE